MSPPATQHEKQPAEHVNDMQQISVFVFVLKVSAQCLSGKEKTCFTFGSLDWVYIITQAGRWIGQTVLFAEQFQLPSLCVLLYV